MRQALVGLREEMGLTQDQAAVRLGISRSFYCEIELGTKSPSLELMNRFVDVFGARSVEFFLPVKVASCDTGSAHQDADQSP
jgi:DNA-binding XRE family transcriptional regulator